MKTYIIVPTEKIEYVDFTKVLEDHPGTLRYSLDGNYFTLKYIGDQPDFCYNITKDLIGLEEYSHEQILKILETPEWRSQD